MFAFLSFCILDLRETVLTKFLEKGNKDFLNITCPVTDTV